MENQSTQRQSTQRAPHSSCAVQCMSREASPTNAQINASSAAGHACASRARADRDHVVSIAVTAAAALRHEHVIVLLQRLVLQRRDLGVCRLHPARARAARVSMLAGDHRLRRRHARGQPLHIPVNPVARALHDHSHWHARKWLLQLRRRLQACVSAAICQHRSDSAAGNTTATHIKNTCRKPVHMRVYATGIACVAMRVHV